MESLSYEDCAARISRYLSGPDTAPRIVDLMTLDELQSFKKHFYTSANRFRRAADYCAAEGYLMLDQLWEDLENDTKGPIFLTGFTTLLKLQGSQALENFLRSYLTLQRRSHTVLVAYQCKSFLEKLHDPKQCRLILQSASPILPEPRLIFRSAELPEVKDIPFTSGLQNLPELIESRNGEAGFRVLTARKCTDFPQSLYLLKAEDSIRQFLFNQEPSLQLLEAFYPEDDAFWEELLKAMPQQGNSFYKLVTQRIGTAGNPALAIAHWENYSDFDKNLCFAALKVLGTGNHWTLTEAVQKSHSPNDLIREIYRSVLSLNPHEKSYSARYQERKALLKHLPKDSLEAQDFVRMARGYGKDALYFLTDCSIYEKEAILELLDEYGEAFPRKELEEALQTVYPDLFDYLQDASIEDPFYQEYFSRYRYQKVINHLQPDFEDLVNQQADQLKYLDLSTRSEVLAQQQWENSEVFFIDAMGTEYLGYIAARCKEQKINMSASLCRAELPTITSCNKGFLDELREKGVPVSENDELDKLKHDRNQTYDSELVKYPLHMIQEFEIFSKIVRRAQKKLSVNEVSRIYLIPDHGSSRLARIKSDAALIDAGKSGTHGGRCAPYHPENKAVSQADISDPVNGTSYLCMANYDRFKGGHPFGVECHGGATIEEAVIPVIVLSMHAIAYEITLLTPMIQVTHRDYGALRFASKTNLYKVTAIIDGDKMAVVPDGTGCYKVNLTKRLKPGMWTLDIYSDGELIDSGKTFEVRNKGMKERDLF